MIEIPSNGIYEICVREKEIKVIFRTKDYAMDSYMKMIKKSDEEFRKICPEGLF